MQVVVPVERGERVRCQCGCIALADAVELEKQPAHSFSWIRGTTEPHYLVCRNSRCKATLVCVYEDARMILSYPDRDEKLKAAISLLVLACACREGH